MNGGFGTSQFGAFQFGSVSMVPIVEKVPEHQLACEVNSKPKMTAECNNANSR